MNSNPSASCGCPIVESLCQKIHLESEVNDTVGAVIAKMRERAKAGQLKYGTNLARTDLSELDWLNHAQMEAMDLANYLEALIARSGPGTLFDNMQESALSTAVQLEMLIQAATLD